MSSISSCSTTVTMAAGYQPPNVGFMSIISAFRLCRCAVIWRNFSAATTLRLWGDASMTSVDYGVRFSYADAVLPFSKIDAFLRALVA